MSREPALFTCMDFRAACLDLGAAFTELYIPLARMVGMEEAFADYVAHLRQEAESTRLTVNREREQWQRLTEEAGQS